MVLVALQPGYLPWLGFFEQMYKSDVFVVYDDVQYDKHGWRNRNRIKSADGEQWLTVPVLTKNREKPLVKDVLIDNKINWRRKHLRSIEQSYAKAPFFKDYFPIFEQGYSKQWEALIDIDMFFIKEIAKELGITRRITFSSKLNIGGGQTERLVSICRYFGADIFYEGAAGRNYIDEKQFSNASIKLEYQDYQHPRYDQMGGEFIPYLSAIDLLFNYGPRSLEILSAEEVRKCQI